MSVRFINIFRYFNNFDSRTLNLVVRYFPMSRKLQIFFTWQVKWYWNILDKILHFFFLKCLIFQKTENDFMVEILRLTIHLFEMFLFEHNSICLWISFVFVFYTTDKCANIQMLFSNLIQQLNGKWNIRRTIKLESYIKGNCRQIMVLSFLSKLTYT